MAKPNGSFEKLVAKTNLFDNRAVFVAAHSAARRMVKSLGGSYSATFSLVLRALYVEKRLILLKEAAQKTFRRSDEEIRTDEIRFLTANAAEKPEQYSRWEVGFIADMATIPYRVWSARQAQIISALFGGYSYAKVA